MTNDADELDALKRRLGLVGLCEESLVEIRDIARSAKRSKSTTTAALAMACLAVIERYERRRGGALPG
jgi:hypothetical protein